MKKLLGILGAAGLVVSTSAVLVSCGGGNDTVEKEIVKNEELSEIVESKLINEKDGGKIDADAPANITYKDFFHKEGSNPESYNFLQVNVYDKISESLTNVETKAKDMETVLDWSHKAVSLALFEDGKEIDVKVINSPEDENKTMKTLFLEAVKKMGIGEFDEQGIWNNKGHETTSLALKFDKDVKSEIQLENIHYMTMTFFE
ncbi:lipoprotein [Spiroplasma endosymbiont of Dioctria linearis]|uniref:lipoprotein n=1 Tax=Spiroplasma endosymbiont of Dioctria linearis TaxID=3066290 RepID=UPI00313E65FC